MLASDVVRVGAMRRREAAAPGSCAGRPPRSPRQVRVALSAQVAVGRPRPYLWRMKNPFRYFDSSPEVIRLVVQMYVRYPLSLRNVEDLLAERGIDICHETVRLWWNRFGPMFAAEIRRERVDSMRGCTHWRWHLDEVYVKINGEMHYLWRAVDHEGEVLESFTSKQRNRAAALTFIKRAMKRHGKPQAIVTDGQIVDKVWPTVDSAGGELLKRVANPAYRQLTALFGGTRGSNSRRYATQYQIVTKSLALILGPMLLECCMHFGITHLLPFLFSYLTSIIPLAPPLHARCPSTR